MEKTPMQESTNPNTKNNMSKLNEIERLALIACPVVMTTIRDRGFDINKPFREVLVEFTEDYASQLAQENEMMKQALKQSQMLMKQDLQFRKHNNFTHGLVFLECQIDENEKLLNP